jgi:hypothetical protein
MNDAALSIGSSSTTFPLGCESIANLASGCGGFAPSDEVTPDQARACIQMNRPAAIQTNPIRHYRQSRLCRRRGT